MDVTCLNRTHCCSVSFGLINAHFAPSYHGMSITISGCLQIHGHERSWRNHHKIMGIIPKLGINIAGVTQLLEVAEC